MGREVRRVPPNWNHPKSQKPWGVDFDPMFDETFEHAVAEWQAEKAKFLKDTKLVKKYKTYEEYGGDPPADPSYYRPWKDEEATWYQLWETVSEGTPVSPPFETKEELIRYLAENGDFSDQDDDRRFTQHRSRDKRSTGWGYERAKAFVEAEWAPTLMIADGQMLRAKDIPLEIKNRKNE